MAAIEDVSSTVEERSLLDRCRRLAIARGSIFTVIAVAAIAAYALVRPPLLVMIPAAVPYAAFFADELTQLSRLGEAGYSVVDAGKLFLPYPGGSIRLGLIAASVPLLGATALQFVISPWEPGQLAMVWIIAVSVSAAAVGLTARVAHEWCFDRVTAIRIDRVPEVNLALSVSRGTPFAPKTSHVTIAIRSGDRTLDALDRMHRELPVRNVVISGQAVRCKADWPARKRGETMALFGMLSAGGFYFEDDAVFRVPVLDGATLTAQFE